MKRFIKFSLLLVLLGFFAAALSGAGLYFWAVRDLPGFKNITDYNPPLVTTVYTTEGSVLGYFAKERRFLVPMRAMPEHVPQAFLAAEDSEFYSHEGVDMVGIFRAALRNIQAGAIVQGGSTITQQVIKSLLLTPERSYTRKLKEAILAYRLEKYLSKDEILTIYLNQIYLGEGAYGVEAAARAYFGKHISEVSLAEAAMLAGLPKAPSRYAPTKHLQEARQRQEYVIGRMLSLGWISPEQAAEALETELSINSMPDPSWKTGSYFLEEVRRWLIERYGEKMVYEGGLHVHTTIDMEHQAAAEQALRDGLRASTKRRGWQGPVQHLAPAAYEGWVQNSTLNADGDNATDWFKVLVTEVVPQGATVRAADRQGFITVESMAWCREPDSSKAPEEVQDVTDATTVLSPGDVVWASIRGEQDEGKPLTLNLEQEPRVEGGLVSIDPATGAVKALVGGYSFNRSQFNRATQAKRQPGSAFKPIVYSAALDNGFTVASMMLDAPIVYDDLQTNSTWKPENFEGLFYGPTLLRTALVNSRNLVTIRVAQKLGIDTIIRRARDLGLEAEFPRDLSVSLGSASVSPVNLCQAYSAFPRQGTTIKPWLVGRVTEAWGEELYVSEPEIREAISPQTAYIISNLLQQVVQSGTGWRAKTLGRPVAGKTGTTNEEKDAWFIGFTPYLLTGIYVGFDELQPMGKYETGSRAASPIWVQYREAVEQNYPVQDFTQPAGIVMARIDADSGLLAGPDSTSSYFLPFKAGTQPTTTAYAGKSSGRRPSGASTPGDSQPSSGKAGEDLFRQVF